MRKSIGCKYDQVLYESDEMILSRKNGFSLNDKISDKVDY